MHADSIWTYSKQTCIVYQGKLKCWGENDRGHLGYNHRSNIFQPSDEFVELGGQRIQSIGFIRDLGRFYVLLQDGRVQRWKSSFFNAELPQKKNIAFFEKMV
ncbi:MAG: hypothetical protein AAGJ35_07085, partial [Myxococcota bacterium]